MDKVRYNYGLGKVHFFTRLGMLIDMVRQIYGQGKV